MPTCPNGHHSVAEDWCEVCGYRMLAPAAMPPPPPPPPAHGGPGGPGGSAGYPDPGQPTVRGELCPQCHTPREAQAPFCEECRYNFLTNSPTTYIPPVSAAPPSPPYGQQPVTPQQPPHAPPPHQAPYAPGQPGQPGQPPEPEGPGQSGDWVIPPPSAPPGAPPAPHASAPHPSAPHPSAPPAAGQPMPPQSGTGGYPGAPQQGGWLVTVAPDPAYFGAMMRRSGPEAAQLVLPEYVPEQRIPLSGPQITIGRRRQSTGEAPDIDLAQHPEDPGVSHQHAILVQQPDGSWAVVDQDSTNGTTVNGAEDPIQPYVPVPLNDGDRVHVGAWTTLTLYRT